MKIMSVRLSSDEVEVCVGMRMSQFIAIRDLLIELQHSQYEADSTQNLARILSEEWVLPDANK